MMEDIELLRDRRILAGPVLAAVLVPLLYLLDVSLDLIAITSAIVTITPAIWIRRSRWKEERRLGANISNFLRDMSESVRAGLPLYRAIEVAAEGDYGELTPHLKRMKREISAGLSFEEALEKFISRVKSPRVKRTVSLVLRASRAGGQMADVMKAAASRAERLTDYSEKRRSNIQSYTTIAYASFFVFLAVVYVLANVFIPSLVKAAVPKGIAGLSPAVNPEPYIDAFFYLALVQGGAAGVFAGKLGEGSAIAGLKHSIVLISIAYVFFFVI